MDDFLGNKNDGHVFFLHLYSALDYWEKMVLGRQLFSEC